MTGLDMIDEAQARLQESQSTTASQQSFLYPDHARRSANIVARKNYCLFATSTVDIVMLPDGNGKQVYTPPIRPFRSESIRVNDGNGNVFPIAGISFETANSRYFNWNAQPPQIPPWSGVPQVYVDSGGDSIYLIPVPNYEVQDGLLFDGYFGVDQWWDMADESPLGEAYDEVTICGICIRRCEEMITVDPGYAARLPIYERRYKELMAQHYRERIGKSEATRQAIPSVGKRLGFWAGCSVWGGVG